MVMCIGFNIILNFTKKKEQGFNLPQALFLCKLVLDIDSQVFPNHI